MNSQKVGEKLKELRLAQNLSTNNVEQATKISKMTISRYENGKTVPKVDYLATLAEFYQYPLADLLKLGEIKTLSEIYFLTLEKEVLMEEMNLLIAKINKNYLKEIDQVQKAIWLQMSDNLQDLKDTLIGVESSTDVQQIRGGMYSLKNYVFPLSETLRGVA